MVPWATKLPAEGENVMLVVLFKTLKFRPTIVSVEEPDLRPTPAPRPEIRSISTKPENVSVVAVLVDVTV